MLNIDGKSALNDPKKTDEVQEDDEAAEDQDEEEAEDTQEVKIFQIPRTLLGS